MHTAETSLYHAILVSAAIICSIIVYFVITLILQQRHYRKFYNNKLWADISRLEQERKEIAEELHNDFAPILFAARMKFAAITGLSKKGLLLHEEGLSHLDKLTRKLRNFTKELVPGSLLNKGLKQALQDFFDETGTHSTVQLSFNVQDLPAFPAEKTIHVYRIIQEIIFNTIKHSFATSLTIDIYETKDHFTISTADDGKGFEHKEKMAASNSLGLKNIMNRVDLLQGDIHVRSAKNKGTCYFITLPHKQTV
jgi:two-component system, NarL family, sensor kinase